MPKAKYSKWSDTHSLFIDELKRRSSARVQTDPEFHYVMEDMERLRHKIDENKISLNEDVRRKELTEDKLRKETRSKERLARKIGRAAHLSTHARNGRQAESAIDHVPGENGVREKERDVVESRA